MSRRRRGEDFSHLLESFGNTTEDEKISSSKMVREEEENSETCSYKSAILAGQAADVESRGSTENSYETARSGSTAENPTTTNNSIESCRSEAPSLMNRTIGLNFLPRADLDLSQNSAEPRTSVETDGNVETSEKSSQDPRDTNYNIKDSPQSITSVASRLHSLRINSPRPRRMASTPTDENSEARILKRMSQKFMLSPRQFTERLVTIIDETESGYDFGDNSGVNLSRMTTEFRKMCKFIQDESMPEHMNSTIGFTGQSEENKFTNPQRPETIVESPVDSSSNDDCQTPDTRDVSRKVYRKTPLNIFKKAVRENHEVAARGSPNSTENFVYLEKYLGEESPSPCGRSRRGIPSISPSDISEQLSNRMQIVQKSQEQLASLDETNLVEFETFDSHPDRAAKPKRKDRDSWNEPDACESPVEDGEINEDELSMSLRAELEKQRERCFETARQMQKIEEDARASKDHYPKILERYGIDPEMECRKTIKSLMAYQNCWAKLKQHNTKRNEASSVDSGIDTRSISRTILHASSKKSSSVEPSSKNLEKNTRNYEMSKKSPRPPSVSSTRSNLPRSGSTVATKKSERNIVTGRNILQKNLKKPVPSPRRRSPGNLCPTAKALSRSRSRSGEKSSKTREVQPGLQNFLTPKVKTADENRMNYLSPEVMANRAEIFNSKPSPREFNEEPTMLKRIACTPEKRVKSPSSRYQLLSPNCSPSVGKYEDRLGKIIAAGRTESPSNMKTSKSPRNRFFVTPGKTVPVKNTKRRSKTFFPTLEADMQQEGAQRIVKSLHAPGIYRMGFNTVVSPVGMYIRGTDTNLIQNVQPRKNDMLLTPKKGSASEEKLKFKLSAKRPIFSNSPRTNRIFTKELDSDSQSDDDGENKQEPDFALPKTNYELPACVRTINQSPKNVGGLRTRGLLQSMQNRLVIRHEEKKTGKYNDVPDSGSDSVDMSIHVQRSAEKTNYMNRWKYNDNETS